MDNSFTLSRLSSISFAVLLSSIIFFNLTGQLGGKTEEILFRHSLDISNMSLFSVFSQYFGGGNPAQTLIVSVLAADTLGFITTTKSHVITFQINRYFSCNRVKFNLKSICFLKFRTQKLSKLSRIKLIETKRKHSTKGQMNISKI